MHVQRERFRIRRRDTGAHLDFRLQFNTGWAIAAYCWPKDKAEQIVADIKAGNGPNHFTYGVAEQLEVYPAPICGVCGQGWPQYGVRTEDFEVHRCEKHKSSLACAIEGCSKSRKTEHQPVDDGFFCTEHWRLFVPPRSRMRKAYHALWRRHKRLGRWTPELDAQYHRIWDLIVRRARQAHSGQFEGFVDEDAINKMFGWDS